MGKTRDLFKKIRDNKGTFHAKMGLKKDRNGMGLTEAVGRQATPGITDKMFIGRTDVETETPIFWPTDTKRTFHAKMGSIKDRNGMDLTEAEDIKR